MSRRDFYREDFLTTNEGVPVDNDRNSLTVGDNGQTLLQDTYLIEKLSHFNRERIPERVVHANGAGAHGYFKLFVPMKKYTKAAIFNDTKNITPVFVRFSTVIGSKGSADTLRDPRGFAIKFYTSEGNYDIAGNNLPVFFIRDAIKFPDMVHAFKPSPDTNLPDTNRFWDFIVNTPESTHMITWLFSDFGTRKSFITMPGFGVNTFVWVNEEGKRVLIKYHWKPIAGEECIDRVEAKMLAGEDPDIAKRELYNMLDSGNLVEYEFYVQIMENEETLNLNFNPVDATKVWPEKEFPLIKIGKLVLTDSPSNFFEESEQVAFCPGNLVPGVEPSNCKLLQGRLFAYSDAQRYRLGGNFQQLPINRPVVKVNNNQRDGAMAYDKHIGKINYNPSMLNNGRLTEANFLNAHSGPGVHGDIVRKTIQKENNFYQAGEQYRSYTEKEKNNLIGNIVEDLKMVDIEIQIKAIESFAKADREYGERIKNKLGINIK